MGKRIFPGQTIGIIGGGHSSRLIALEAKKLGYVVATVTEDKDHPTAQMADWYMMGNILEKDSLIDFAKRCDLLVYESEEIDVDLLPPLKPYIEIPQLSDMSAITGDRLIEKVFLESLNINIAPYYTITNVADLDQAVKGLGFPCILKPIRIEATQPENLYIYSEQDFEKAERILQTGSCILEAWISYEKELAITIVGSREQKESSDFPVSQMIYEAEELQAIVTPAVIEKVMNEAIVKLAKTIAHSIQLTGLLTVEFFVTASGAIYVKKIISNPHVSCEYSLHTCNISQYEAMIRVLCGFPVPTIILWKPCVSYPIYTKNLEEVYKKISKNSQWFFHFYGHQQSRGNYEMGSLTVMEEKTGMLLEEMRTHF